MKQRIIAIDLETIADPAMIAILPDVKPSGTLKDPAKIEADIQAKKKKQIEDMGLSPLYNLICCAGYHDSDGKKGSIILEDETKEKDLLLDFWDVLSHYDHFVTFNGRGFDLKCMYFHGISYGIMPSVNIDRGRYNRSGSNHTDLRGILAGEDAFATGKLDFFCKKYLGDHKTEGIDGALVQGYWDMGLKEDIATYCEKDCELTMRLFEKVKIAGLLE